MYMNLCDRCVSTRLRFFLIKGGLYAIANPAKAENTFSTANASSLLRELTDALSNPQLQYSQRDLVKRAIDRVERFQANPPESLASLARSRNPIARCSKQLGQDIRASRITAHCEPSTSGRRITKPGAEEGSECYTHADNTERRSDIIKLVECDRDLRPGRIGLAVVGAQSSFVSFRPFCLPQQYC
jgi:hypothetical protein